MANEIDLKGRVAVVTGGAQGFGRACVERFIASGARVAIWDNDVALANKTASEVGNDTIVAQCDVSDFDSISAARDATVSAAGKIDILINNAGIAGANATTWDTEVDEWRKVMRINLDGPFLCCKAVVPVDDRERLRPDCQRRLDRGQGRQPQRRALFRVEGGCDRAHQVARQGTRGPMTSRSTRSRRPPPRRRSSTRSRRQHIDFMLSKIPRNRFVKVEEMAAMARGWCRQRTPSQPAPSSTCQAGARPTRARPTLMRSSQRPIGLLSRRGASIPPPAPRRSE
jgi:hypothetical protein